MLFVKDVLSFLLVERYGNTKGKLGCNVLARARINDKFFPLIHLMKKKDDTSRSEDTGFN